MKLGAILWMSVRIRPRTNNLGDVVDNVYIVIDGLTPRR
jgi:hypothetical protein